MSLLRMQFSYRRQNRKRKTSFIIQPYVVLFGSGDFFSLAYNVKLHVQYFFRFYVYENAELYVAECSIKRARSLTKGEN